MNDDGRCYSFDSRGAGYGRAEGVATVVLKRLDDALRDGDPIRAVLRHTGCNSDGKTNGILLPSSSSQQALMANLYISAGIDPSECDYVEVFSTTRLESRFFSANLLYRPTEQGLQPVMQRRLILLAISSAKIESENLLCL